MIVHRNVVVVLLILIIFTALTALTSCGGSIGGGDFGSPETLILEDASSVDITNIKALLESSDIPAYFLSEDEDPEDFKDRWRDEWEDDSRALATDPDVVTHDTSIDASVGRYYITSGEFDFNAIKNELEDQGYDDGTYRDQEIWESERGDRSFALFESAGFYVSGPTDAVKEVLKAIDRGKGFMATEADLRRAIDKIDGGALFVSAESNCSNLRTAPNGCRAISLAITGGTEDSTEVTGSAVFSSERRAESGIDDLEDDIEDDDSVDVDIEEIKVDGEIIIYKLTFYN